MAAPTSPPVSTAGRRQVSLSDALAAQRGGDSDRAVALAGAWLQQHPDDVDALQILAVAETQRGNVPAARIAFDRAIACAPTNGGLRFNFGTFLDRTGDTGAAIQQLAAAVECAPDHVEALYNLGRLHQERGDLEQAENFMRRAVAIRPLYARGWSGLATVLKMRERPDEAEAACRRALAIDPNRVVARMTLASLCRDSGRAAEALSQLRAALEIDPANGQALAYLVHQLQQACDWRDLPQLGARLDAANEAAVAAGVSLPEPMFAQHARVDDPARNLVLARAHVREFERIAPLPSVGPPSAIVAADAAPIRIGWLGGDFEDHPVGQLVASVIGRHDRTRFHASVYSWSPDDGSAVRRRIEAGADSFVDIAALDLRAAAERIRADGIEILIDLMGHTQGQRLGILAHRPAPVQATFLGFPGGTGAGFIDYILADRIVLPPEHAPFYVEQPVWLPHAYMPPGLPPEPASPGTRADWHLPPDSPVLASFNNGYKIEPVLFDAWMAILRQVPGAVLWLHRYNDLVGSNLAREAAARGIDPARLVFADRPSKPVHLARLSHADLALDTRLFNGHSTTLDALRAGVPVLAIEGRHFASRVAVSLLHAAGLPELVARDPQHYVEIALSLLQDRPTLGALRGRLATAHSTAPLFDADRYARDFDCALRLMSQRQRNGDAPAPIAVPAD